MTAANDNSDLPDADIIMDSMADELIGYNLKRSYLIVRNAAEGVLAPLGLRVVSMTALSLIVDNPGIAPSQIADALQMERPNIVVIIDDLETRQLTREALLGVMNRHPDLVALYCAGGGMEGVIAALREGTAHVEALLTLARTEVDGNFRAIVSLIAIVGTIPVLLIVTDGDALLVVTGAGDVLEPEHGLVAIGSGGAYAQAAAKALLDHTELPADQIVKKALEIAGELCIYTNMHHTVESL